MQIKRFIHKKAYVDNYILSRKLKLSILLIVVLFTIL